MGGAGPYRFDLEFDVGHNLVRAVHAGICVLPRLNAFVDAIMTDPRWVAGIRVLSDFRMTDASRLSNDDMWKYATHMATYAERLVGSRVATVADRPLNFGMVRVWEAFAAAEGMPFEHQVFRTVAEAERWLGVPPKR